MPTMVAIPLRAAAEAHAAQKDLSAGCRQHAQEIKTTGNAETAARCCITAVASRNRQRIRGSSRSATSSKFQPHDTVPLSFTGNLEKCPHP